MPFTLAISHSTRNPEPTHRKPLLGVTGANLVRNPLSWFQLEPFAKMGIVVLRSAWIIRRNDYRDDLNKYRLPCWWFNPSWMVCVDKTLQAKLNDQSGVDLGVHPRPPETPSFATFALLYPPTTSHVYSQNCSFWCRAALFAAYRRERLNRLGWISTVQCRGHPVHGVGVLNASGEGGGETRGANARRCQKCVFTMRWVTSRVQCMQLQW